MWLCLIFGTAGAQSVDLKDLTAMLDLGQNKLEARLEKKGFRRTQSEAGSLRFIREEKPGPDYQLRSFEIISSGTSYELAYETTCVEEYRLLTAKLNEAGFIKPPKLADTNNVLYQRENITIQSCRKKEDSVLFYVLRACKKSIPKNIVKRKELEDAEDLLQLNGQDYLVEMFGRANVKTDWFFYDDKDSNICSVIFPNTCREAIFIWNDETNLKDIAFILLGGSLKSKSEQNAIANNTWISKQGLYCGMSLQEVERINKEPVKFYNWRSSSAGYLAPGNSGTLDFNRIGLVFNCLNCHFLKISSGSIIGSDIALQEEQKVYVTTLIILPDKKGNEQHE